jgi:hypothetical protein
MSSSVVFEFSSGFDPLHPDVDVWAGMSAADRGRGLCAVDAEIGRLLVAKAGIEVCLSLPRRSGWK